MTLHTEDEARGKWCERVRVSAANEPMTGNHAANRDADGNWNRPCYLCIASDCMAWRWGLDEMRERYPKQPHDMPDGTVEEYRHRKGYCGAFGRPE